MRQEPQLAQALVREHLHTQYRLAASEIEFLPLGADFNAFLYRVVAESGATYFLKVRRDAPSPASLEVPHFLAQQGVGAVIPPLAAVSGALWASLGEYATVLYPYVEGKNGFQQELSERQWMALGAALREVHSQRVPPDLHALLPTETYTDRYRQRVGALLRQAEGGTFADPLAAELAGFLCRQRDAIRTLVQRTGQLALQAQDEPQAQVLCHTDLHGGNVLLSGADQLTIVDWDEPLLAPKERDLMFIGYPIGRGWSSPRAEFWFYEGYGEVGVNATHLAYYRYERIVQDIAAYCEQILLTEGEILDRQQGYQYFLSQFQPGDVIQVARETDQQLLGYA